MAGQVLNSLKDFWFALTETYTLMWLGITNSFYNLGILLVDFFYFWKNSLLRKINWELFWQYAFLDPYAISTREGSRVNLKKENLIYGETPYFSIYKILKYINPTKDDIFYDLGSGRGSVIFFINIYLKIRAIGIEIIPSFVKNSNHIKAKLNLQNIEFLHGNFLDYDINDGTIFYIAGTCFDDDIVEKIVQKVKEFKTGTWVISLSYPLNSPYLKVEKTFVLPYSWGKGTVYIHRKIS